MVSQLRIMQYGSDILQNRLAVKSCCLPKRQFPFAATEGGQSTDVKI